MKSWHWFSFFGSVFLVTAFVVVPSHSGWPAILVELRASLSEFQTMIGGVFALIAGAFAYLGIRQQINASEFQHRAAMKAQELERKQSAAHFEQEQTRLRDEALRRDLATTVAIAARLNRTAGNVVTHAGRMVDNVKNSAKSEKHAAHYTNELKNYVLPDLAASCIKFDGVVDWVYERLPEISSARQGALLLTMGAATNCINQLQVRQFFVQQALDLKAQLTLEHIGEVEDHLGMTGLAIDALAGIVSCGGDVAAPTVQERQKKLMISYGAKFKVSAND